MHLFIMFQQNSYMIFYMRSFINSVEQMVFLLLVMVIIALLWILKIIQLYVEELFHGNKDNRLMTY